jgi:divalent metal cation (Fe/Co/Zn/Cd) transporter
MDAAGWNRRALWLIATTMTYNVVEAGVALTAGILARSVALVGFGLDSVIELIAATAVLRRVALARSGRDPERLEAAEHRVHRIVGVTFVLLALYVTAQAAWQLWQAAEPHESIAGIVLACASLLIMPGIAWGKLKAAAALGSPALRAEARETLACSYLSFTLLLGLGLNAWLGWWWADPVAALCMVPWLVKEGAENIRGVGCCAEGHAHHA